ncbi:MAG TPA: histidine kinase [Candidatus Limnocylindrales bacterium]
MPARTAWEAISLRPLRFLVSPWPWRSLDYLSSSAVSTVALLAMIRLNVPMLAALALPMTLVMARRAARYERWKLRLVDDDVKPVGEVRPAVEFGYGVVCILVLWLIDMAVVVGAFAGPVALTVYTYQHPPGSWRNDPNWLRLVLAVLLLAVAAYMVCLWAGARAALTRVILMPRDSGPDTRLIEVTRSRARLVDAFEMERRRIERDLHDGAQQHLVAVTMALGLAQLDLPRGSPAAAQVAAAHEHAERALDGLRELIRGVHPHVLTDRGLCAAITDAASRSPVPVDLAVSLPHRLPSGIEVAAYFAVCEALANIAKHSQAGHARVKGWLAPPDGRLVIEVSDDGGGGADPSAGSGLTGLADRIAVVDGRLLLSSPPGGPTVLRLEVPCPQTVHSG